MTDPTTPNHDQPVEGSRSDSYTAPDAGNLGSSTGDIRRPATAPRRRRADVFESLREAIEDFAEKASPAVRQFSARAAEVVATAADKAAPLAHKAGDATADASGSSPRSRGPGPPRSASRFPDNGPDTTTDKPEPPTTV